MINVVKNVHVNTVQKGKRCVISMNLIKFLLFVVLLLITPNVFGQNRGSGSYSPSGLVQEFKDVVNNLKKEAEFSRAIENDKKFNPQEFKDASKYTVIAVFNHAVNQDNYEAAKVMLDYMYANKYDKAFISKYKTLAMWRVIKSARVYVYSKNSTHYFKYETAKIKKYAQLLVDKDTNLQYLYDKTTYIASGVPFTHHALINSQEVLIILRNAKYK